MMLLSSLNTLAVEARKSVRVEKLPYARRNWSFRPLCAAHRHSPVTGTGTLFIGRRLYSVYYRAPGPGCWRKRALCEVRNSFNIESYPSYSHYIACYLKLRMSKASISASIYESAGILCEPFRPQFSSLKPWWLESLSGRVDPRSCKSCYCNEDSLFLPNNTTIIQLLVKIMI